MSTETDYGITIKDRKRSKLFGLRKDLKTDCRGTISIAMLQDLLSDAVDGVEIMDWRYDGVAYDDFSSEDAVAYVEHNISHRFPASDNAEYSESGSVGLYSGRETEEGIRCSAYVRLPEGYGVHGKSSMMADQDMAAFRFEMTLPKAAEESISDVWRRYDIPVRYEDEPDYSK